MTVTDLHNKQVAVLGYGNEGKAVTRYLLKNNIKPVLFDQRPWEQWNESDRAEIKRLSINFIFGPDCLKELRGFDVAFRSPGIWRLNPELLAQEQAGLCITSQTIWFFEHCPAHIVGVTGTKGKGTTSSLIYNILAQSVKIDHTGFQPYLTGNIGKTAPLDLLDSLQKKDIVVFELSSFQLQDLPISPQLAVVLMISHDHLDVHATPHEYQSAKEAIVKYQTLGDIAIINDDNAVSRSFASLTPARTYFFSGTHSVENGCFVKNGKFIIRGLSDSEPELILMDTHELRLRGMHNWQNVAAAAIAGLLLGASAQSVTQAISTFNGLRHRLEFVAEKNKISFYDDSLSTIEETSIAAINSFTEPIILILGGYEKHTGYGRLAEEIINHDNLKAIVLIGQTAPRIKALLNRSGGYKGVILEKAGNMSQIMKQVTSVANPGDVALLSPGAASFDMFKNYSDRGDQFKREVMALV